MVKRLILDEQGAHISPSLGEVTSVVVWTDGVTIRWEVYYRCGACEGGGRDCVNNCCNGFGVCSEDYTDEYGVDALLSVARESGWDLARLCNWTDDELAAVAPLWRSEAKGSA